MAAGEPGDGARREAGLLLWEAVEHLWRQMRRRLEPALRTTGLRSPVEIGVCRMLRQCGPVRMTDLAARIGVPPSTASEMIERLVGEGLVARLPHPGDRRSVVLSATPAAAQALAAMRETVAEGLADMLRGLTVEELDQVVSGLRIVTDALSSASGAHAPGAVQGGNRGCSNAPDA